MNEIKEKIIKDFCDAQRIDNFRLDADGSLLKREGYSLLSRFNKPVHSVYNDRNITYVVAGNTLYMINEDTLEEIGSLDACTFYSDSEAASMFMEMGYLKIMGGGAYYEYSPYTGILREAVGYAPIILKNATSRYDGVPYEERNLISSHVRMSFDLTSMNRNVLELWGDVTAIYDVVIDGEILNKSNYSSHVSENEAFVIIKNDDVLVDAVEAVIEYELSTESYPLLRNQYFSNCKTHVCEDEFGKRLLLYKESEVGIVRMSSLHKGDRTPYSVTIDYFPDKSFFTVGDGTKPVRCITSLGSRTIIMTADMIHEMNVAKNEDEFGVITQILSTEVVTPEMGIGYRSGIILFDDELYFSNEHGLFRFAYNAETFQYYAVQIDFADYVKPPKGAYEAIRLFLYRQRNEIWCCYNGYAAVYNLKFKRWYRFTGIGTGNMFVHNGDAAFYLGNDIYTFDENNYTDNGSGFEAVFESKKIDFGNMFSNKTVFGFGVAFDRFDGVMLNCTLINDKGTDFNTEFEGNGESEMPLVVKRTHARLGNTFYVICRICSPAFMPPANVRQIMFRYRENGGSS